MAKFKSRGNMMGVVLVSCDQNGFATALLFKK